MKREYFFTGRISRDGGTGRAAERRVTEAEAALRERPDSRDRHRSLVRALSAAGNVQRALEVTEQWIERDQLDPEALTYRANLLAQLGNRDEAIRTLSGVVDLAPDDKSLHQRLATAFGRLEDRQRACAFRVSLGELAVAELNQLLATGRASRSATTTAKNALGLAVRCVREQRGQKSAERLVGGLANAETRSEVTRSSSSDSDAEQVRGALTLDARWSGSEDLDLALIDRNGIRVSWMGGRRTVASEHAAATGREKLGLRWAAPGSYRIEITRSQRTPGRSAVSGTVEVRVHGQRQRLPFTLQGERASVGRVDVRRESRMVPVSGPLPFR